MTSTELATTPAGAVANQPTTDLTIRSDQSDFTPIQRAALAQLGVEEASDDDVKVFFHQCRTTGLDPFRKQIYMIGRRTKVKEWNPNTRQQEEKWVMKQTIQIGIDGYRLACRRIANALGIKVETDGPYWHDGDQWRDVWLDPTSPPRAAKFTITRDGETYTATANYAEYVQTYNTQQGPKPNSMWAKMPANQLAKCAEAAARRQAFPDQFSGVVFEDAAQHNVIDGEVMAEPKPTKKGASGVNGVAAALGVTQVPAEQPDTPVDVEQAPADSIPDTAAPPSNTPSKDALKTLNGLFERAGIGWRSTEDKAKKKTVIETLIGRTMEDAASLTADEVAHVTEQLEQVATEGANSGTGDQLLVDTITQILAEKAAEQ